MPESLAVGEILDWKPVQRPGGMSLRGAHVLVRPVEPDVDAQPLFAASHPPEGDLAIWTYLPDGPYETADDLRRMLAGVAGSGERMCFTLATLPGEHPLGTASYLAVTPEFGVIEIGHIWFGTPLQQTTAATEAIFLLASHAFDDLGYRRLEWKCNALNAASRRAAARLGFTFEGVFRQHQVVKGRNRDTAWYSIVDCEWPAIRQGYEAWLAVENFDADARQKRSLGELIRVAQG
jgi:RimJ/RimL family protein N-acetyltransferase